VTLADIVDQEAAAAAVVDQAAHADAVASLGRIGRSVARHSAAALVSEMIDVDLREVLEDAWAHFDELRAECCRTRGHRASRSRVALASFVVDWSRKGHLDISWAGTSVYQVPLKLTANVTVASTNALITGGRVSEIQLSDASVCVVLQADGIDAARGSRPLGGVTSLPLEPGIALCEQIDGLMVSGRVRHVSTTPTARTEVSRADEP
jgi:hypothetical protein